MSKIKPKIIEYYDYHELAEAVEAKAGKKIRDWAGRWSSGDKNVPYQDFWHYAIDNIFPGVENGSMWKFAPKEYLEHSVDFLIDENGKYLYWVEEVLKYFIEVFKENNLPDTITVLVEW